jgi:hypothetical protein
MPATSHRAADRSTEFRRKSPPSAADFPPLDRADLAAYIANLAAELVALSRIADLRTLAYLTDMVRLEAEHQLAALNNRGKAPATDDQASETRPAESR